MAKHYLIEANDIPTSMMQRINLEGQKPVEFKVTTKAWWWFSLFGKEYGVWKETKRMNVAWNWNPKVLKPGREIVFPS